MLCAAVTLVPIVAFVGAAAALGATAAGLGGGEAAAAAAAAASASCLASGRAGFDSCTLLHVARCATRATRRQLSATRAYVAGIGGLEGGWRPMGNPPEPRQARQEGGDRQTRHLIFLLAHASADRPRHVDLFVRNWARGGVYV